MERRFAVGRFDGSYEIYEVGQAGSLRGALSPAGSDARETCLRLLCSPSRPSPPATTTDSPTGNRTTPPTINSVSPRGVPRGATTELTVEGLNLAKASAVFFSEPGVTARILRIKELPDGPDVRLGSNGGISTVDRRPAAAAQRSHAGAGYQPGRRHRPRGFSLADAARHQSRRALPD